MKIVKHNAGLRCFLIEGGILVGRLKHLSAKITVLDEFTFHRALS